MLGLRLSKKGYLQADYVGTEIKVHFPLQVAGVKNVKDKARLMLLKGIFLVGAQKCFKYNNQTEGVTVLMNNLLHSDAQTRTL